MIFRGWLEVGEFDRHAEAHKINPATPRIGRPRRANPPIQTCGIRLTDSLIIPQAIFAPFTVDGEVTIWLVVDSTNAACCVRPEILNLRYEAAMPVAEPATLAIFALGLAGMGVMRRRKRMAV
ncbi:MAG: PEP-CTERM sorting domain-containing protein [Rhodospirillales bacterium]|nr:PEP-CTERM sorting domain-containing protein [Rhodospirillales bacterium]